MLNYRNNKEKYKINELGSLYVDRTSLNPNEQPTIYIGGQMEHRCHILEQTGYTADPGHNMFNGSWFYDYPVFSKNKAAYNAQNFATNLSRSLEEANLQDVILITESFGGSIAAYATKSDRINQVIAIHPSITGTPLANPKAISNQAESFTPKQKAILKILDIIVNTDYGFEQDNFQGIDLSKVDLNKLLVVGSSIDKDTEKNPIVLQTNSMIEQLTNYKNDGIVIFDQKQLDNLGINYLTEDEQLNHFDAGTKEHIAKVYKKVIQK